MKGPKSGSNVFISSQKLSDFLPFWTKKSWQQRKHGHVSTWLSGDHSGVWNRVLEKLISTWWRGFFWISLNWLGNPTAPTLRDLNITQVPEFTWILPGDVGERCEETSGQKQQGREPGLLLILLVGWFIWTNYLEIAVTPSRFVSLFGLNIDLNLGSHGPILSRLCVSHPKSSCRAQSWRFLFGN